MAVFDESGEILYRAYVNDAEQGFRGAELEGFVVPSARLQGLDFTGAHLYWAVLTGADLSFAIFSCADLRGANLDRAICRGTSFRSADFGRDNLGGRTSLKGADLSSADLNGAILLDAIFDSATKFPEGFDPSSAGMVQVDGT